MAGTASSGSNPGHFSFSRTNPPGKVLCSMICIFGGAGTASTAHKVNSTVNRTVVFEEIVGMALGRK
jgi:hypothetical protein